MVLVTRAFCADDAAIVAPRLLGTIFVRDAGTPHEVALRVTEVEAYPPGDSASHCRFGRTKRNAPMWGPPGHAYVFLCYGVHALLNVVTNDEGEGAAVLIRGCEVLRGSEIIRARRETQSHETDLAGPGRVGAALGLDASWSGHALVTNGGLELHQGAPPKRISAGPRIGIGYATAADQKAPLRFANATSKAVSFPRLLSRSTP